MSCPKETKKINGTNKYPYISQGVGRAPKPYDIKDVGCS
jgi:hypothetical protein